MLKWVFWPNSLKSIGVDDWNKNPLNTEDLIIYINTGLRFFYYTANNGEAN